MGQRQLQIMKIYYSKCASNVIQKSQEFKVVYGLGSKKDNKILDGTSRKIENMVVRFT